MVTTIFSLFSRRVADAVGSAWTFLVAASIVTAWVIGGFIFGFGDTYQLIINTGTTCVTFLMVFLIQNTQNRDMRVINLKLDELALAVSGAKNSVVAVEKQPEVVLEQVAKDHNARVKTTTILA